MRQKIFITFFLSIILFFNLPGSLSYATSKQQTEKDLKSLQLKINKLTRAIDVKLDSKSQYIKQLKSIEKSLGSISKNIQQINSQISQKQQDIKSLQQTRRKHQMSLAKQNEFLSKQVFSAYTLGKQERMKLIFSQQNPEVFQRNLVYYQYFSNARVNLINNVQKNIIEILETESKISQKKQVLEEQNAMLSIQKDKLRADSNKRKSIISSLDKQLKKQGGHLSKLREDETELQGLLESIEEIFKSAPEHSVDRKMFSQLKGKLAWPVEGKLKKLFGRQKPLSNLRWQGIFIESPAGRHVKAVSHGRIAFSDWLRGMGNLIIIDHGNSYLSLYGHNESLFKSAGEWVEAGDIIGSIGSSGGQQKSGLYFEIRKKGKPQNPTKWCKAGNHFASL